MTWREAKQVSPAKRKDLICDTTISSDEEKKHDPAPATEVDDFGVKLHTPKNSNFEISLRIRDEELDERNVHICLDNISSKKREDFEAKNISTAEKVFPVSNSETNEKEVYEDKDNMCYLKGISDENNNKNTVNKEQNSNQTDRQNTSVSSSYYTAQDVDSESNTKDSTKHDLSINGFEDVLGETVDDLVDDLMQDMFPSGTSTESDMKCTRTVSATKDTITNNAPQRETRNDNEISSRETEPLSTEYSTRITDSDDAIDEAIELALSDSNETYRSQQKMSIGNVKIVNNTQERNLKHSQDLLISPRSEENRRSNLLMTLSPQSEGPIMKRFSDMKSLDEDDNIDNYLRKMEVNGTEDFYLNFTPPEGASDQEIEELNKLVRNIAIERKANGESGDITSIYDQIKSQGINCQNVGVECISHQHVQQEYKDNERAREVSLSVSSESNDDELVNAFLTGAKTFSKNHATESGQISYLGNPLKNVMQIIEDEDDAKKKRIKKAEISSTIQTSEADFFSKLMLGASEYDSEKVKLFIKYAELITDESSSPYLREAQLRIEASRIGVRKDYTEQIIDQVIGPVTTTIVETFSSDTIDLAKVLNGEKFKEIEEIDESENITAYLSRMSALEVGGHFGERKGSKKLSSNEEVEIDVNHGFVNKELEPEPIEEGPWWNEDGISKSNTTNSEKTALQDISVRIVSSDEQSKDERYSRLPRGRSCEKNRNARHMERYATDNTKVPLNRVHATARNSLNSGSFDTLLDNNGGSLSLSRVPSLFNNLEAMFEQREEWTKSHLSTLRLSQSQSVEFESPVPSFQAPEIGGVSAALTLKRWSINRREKMRIPLRRSWNLPYRERTKDHPGYFSVDVFSLYETSAVVGVCAHRNDDEIWENRNVRQRFLHEKSISLSRNWFGNLLRKRGNDRYKEPVAHPKSMEMPIENLPDEGDWIEEWYTTWQQKKIDERRETSETNSESDGSSYGSESYTYDGDTTWRGDESVTSCTSRGDCSQSIYNKSVSENVNTSRQSVLSQSKRSARRSSQIDDDDDDDDEDSWEDEDPPECGTFQNVKLKIGERISLVTPEHLSSLRRSRWRKQYFPRGTFPYKG